MPTAERDDSTVPSPAEVADRILGKSSYPALRRLKCRFEAGTLFITGRLPSFYLKQLAQTVVQDIDGVDRVDSRIEVAE